MPEKDYSATPLTKKLGIREDSRVALVGAPEGFARTLDPVPAGAEVRRQARAPVDVVLFFSRRRAELLRRFASLAKVLDPAGRLWVAWPKKVSRVETDLTFEVVQRIGLDAGLVDNKSVAIDEVWQGLQFVFRLKDRPKARTR